MSSHLTETLVCSFVAGAATPAEIATVDAHASDCAACCALIAAAAAALPGTVYETSPGRITLLDPRTGGWQLDLTSKGDRPAYVFHDGPSCGAVIDLCPRTGVRFVSRPA